MISCDPQSLAKASVCFDFCVSAGNTGPLKTFLLCKIANTSKFSGGGAAIGQLTGFNFVPNSLGAAIAAWNAPPAGATATELWTSPDNVTFSLDSTNPSPSVGTNTTAPAVGSFKWAKARWVSATAQGAFCTSQEVSGRVCDWQARVITNGGAGTSLTTRTAMNTFDLALVSNSLDSLMLTLMPFVPDSLIAAQTPLYKVIGGDPWLNNGPFVAGDLTVSGLQGNGTTKWLGNTINPSTQFPLNNCCLFLYMSVAQSNVGDLFGANATQLDGLFPNDQNSGSTNYYSQSNIITVAALTAAGFYLGSRVSNTDQRLFFANSTNAWAQKGFSATAAGASPNQANVPAFAVNSSGAASNLSNGALSCIGVAKGLTSAQGQTLFNAVDALRIALGGGRV